MKILSQTSLGQISLMHMWLVYLTLEKQGLKTAFIYAYHLATGITVLKKPLSWQRGRAPRGGANLDHPNLNSWREISLCWLELALEFKVLQEYWLR